MSLAAGARLALRQAQGDLEQGRKVSPHEVLGLIGPGGPASARGRGLQGPPQPPVTHVNLIQNWFEELKVKVPTQAR